ncbi:site-specific tyrosine recombinase/integron integrase [Haliovirga abyssi]|uniref:Tyrosine recombinase XerD n=1 Tax=Haliovirga abyssi TaxID=2996794 RepID=A0AAU9DSM0_9FUSO|nr:site-specific tyrosine recombinase/integron integrase [Haliovirga abyssi]BDU50049.1 tyrosine recombinase XerD [Haliovirga abyssi]
MGIKEDIEEYVDYIKFEKGLSENTVLAYNSDLKEFFKSLEWVDYKNVTEDDILRYIEKLKQGKESTLLRKVTSIRTFYTYLFKSGKIDEIPTENLDNLKKSSYMPEVLSLDEIKSIILAIDSSLRGKRDKLILQLLVATGARISEILGLKIEDIDENMQFIKIKGKGNKLRIIPLYKEISEEVYFYLKNIRNKIAKDPLSFLLFDGVSRTTFWKRVKIYAKNAGIKKNVYPHIFRHSMATLMIKNGADLRIVQEILGHSSISTTEIYTHIGNSDLKNIYNRIGIGEDLDV